MSLTNVLRKKLIDISGYWIYRRKELPIGTDLMEDLKNKIGIDLQTIFDVGANVGDTTLEYVHSFPKAQVWSFEPVSKTFEELKRRTKNFGNVHSYNLALGEKEEAKQIKLFDDNLSYLNSLKPLAMNEAQTARTETIQVTTLDSFLEKEKISSVDLLKIDTEGYELSVLRGAQSAIANNKIKLIFLEVGFSASNKRNSNFSEINNYLDTHGFSFFSLYHLVPIGLHVKSHYGNALYIHDSVIKKLKVTTS
jgi:FkbM family methyltransferase